MIFAKVHLHFPLPAVYGQKELFAKLNTDPPDKILVICYSNMGLDVSSAILSDHPDLWFMSANPYDPILLSSNAKR